MSFEIRQKTTYKGEDWWKWSVWVEAPARELDTIKVVTYVLHPTFRNRVRKIESRATKFRLDSSAWGSFTIRVQIEFKDGSKQRLTHELVLQYPTQPSSRDAGRAKTATKSRIFVSSSAADGSAAALVKKVLRHHKIELLDPMAIKSSLPWSLAVSHTIRKSDAVIAVSPDTPSESVRSEIEIARSVGIPVIRVNPQSGSVSVELGAPLDGVWDVPMKGILDVPMKGVLNVPMKGVLDVPMKGVLDAPRKGATSFRSEGPGPSRLTPSVLSKLAASIQKQIGKTELA